MVAALRIGYVGAGRFSNLMIYPQLGGHAVDLVAVCDLVEEKARRAQQQYRFRHAYTDFRKMCDEQELDAVICVGGPTVHHAVGMEILERGLPLYVQKSPAPSAAQTREMAEVARRKGVVCHVGFNIRSSVAGLRAKQILATPEFGRPSLCIVRYGFVYGATMRDAVMDQHCHAVDMACYLAGDISSLQVIPGSMPGLRHYVVGAHFANGSVGTINFTSEQGGQEFFYFEVTGEKGHILISHQFSLRYKRAAEPVGDLGLEPDQVLETTGENDERGMRWNGYVSDVANYLAAVRGEAADRSPIESTIRTMELCEEIYRQLRASGVGP